MVFRTVVVARIVPGSESKVGDVFGHFDKTTRPQDLGVIGRRILSLHGLYIHVIDRNVDPKISGQNRGLPAFKQIGEAIAPYVTPYPKNWQKASDSVAKEFYSWAPDEESGAESDSGGTNLTVIVAHIKPNAEPDIARIFAESDAGPLPAQMGVRGRSLYSIDDLYLHLLDRGDDAAFAGAMRQAHGNPAFTKVMEDLSPYISPFRPDAWRSHEDAVAKEFYSWRASD